MGLEQGEAGGESTERYTSWSCLLLAGVRRRWRTALEAEITSAYIEMLDCAIRELQGSGAWLACDIAPVGACPPPDFVSSW